MPDNPPVSQNDGLGIVRFVRRGNQRVLIILICALLVFFKIVAMPFWMAGDAQEYAAMTIAWAAHASPDVRGSDVAMLNHLLQSNGVNNPERPLPTAPPWKGFYEAQWPLVLLAFLVLFAAGGSVLRFAQSLRRQRFIDVSITEHGAVFRRWFSTPWHNCQST